MGGFARSRRHRRDVAGSARQRGLRRARRVVRARLARRRRTAVTPPDLDLWRDELASVPTEEKVRIALELERATKAADPRIRNVESASYGDAFAESALANSLGVESHTRRTTCSASAVALADDGSGTQSGYGFVAGRTLVRSRPRIDPARRGDARVPVARRQARARAPHPGDPRPARDPFGARRPVERVQRRVDAEGPLAVRGPRRRDDRRAVRAARRRSHRPARARRVAVRRRRRSRPVATRSSSTV